MEKPTSANVASRHHCKILSTIFAQLQNLGELPKDFRRENVIPIFKAGKKEEPGNYRPVSLTLILRKVILENIFILATILRHMKEKKLLSSSQHVSLQGSHASST